MFELTKEQKEEIFSDYDVTDKALRKIVAGLNESNLIKDEKNILRIAGGKGADGQGSRRRGNCRNAGRNRKTHNSGY